MNAAELFGVTTEEFQTIVTIFTLLNFLMILYTIWLRKKIREAGEQIEINHRKTIEVADTIFSAAQFSNHKKMKDYNKLTSKNDWYIFGLINLALTNKNRNANDKIDIMESFIYIGIAWCKRPEDVGVDYMIVVDGLVEITTQEKPTKVGRPVLSGGNF